jgi:hypothetical protein
LTSTGGEPPFKPDKILYRCFCPFFQFPFNIFHRFTRPFQPAASQPYFHSLCILNFLYMLFLSFCLSAFVYVCCSVLWFIFRVSLALHFCSHRYLDLGCEAFNFACSRPSRQRLNWARNHQKSPLAQWLERWSYEL